MHRRGPARAGSPAACPPGARALVRAAGGPHAPTGALGGRVRGDATGFGRSRNAATGRRIAVRRRVGRVLVQRCQPGLPGLSIGQLSDAHCVCQPRSIQPPDLTPLPIQRAKDVHQQRQVLVQLGQPLDHLVGQVLRLDLLLHALQGELLLRRERWLRHVLRQRQQPPSSGVVTSVPLCSFASIVNSTPRRRPQRSIRDPQAAGEWTGASRSPVSGYPWGWPLNASVGNMKSAPWSYPDKDAGGPGSGSPEPSPLLPYSGSAS